MAVNQVFAGSTKLMDVTGVTATQADVANTKTFMSADGSIYTGTLVPVDLTSISQNLYSTNVSSNLTYISRNGTVQTGTAPHSWDHCYDLAYDNLTSISFNNLNSSFRNATYIRNYAFAANYKLQTVNASGTYPMSYIGAYAFDYCSSLTLVRLHHNTSASLTTIYNGAFYGCWNLERVGTMLGGISCYLGTIYPYAFYECSKFLLYKNGMGCSTYYTSSIGNYAFYGCWSIPFVTYGYGNSTYTGNYAFGYCSELSTVYILGSSRTYIESYAFAYCRSLSKVNVNFSKDGLYIGNYAFVGGNTSKDVWIKAYNITEVSKMSLGGYYAFEGVRSVIMSQTLWNYLSNNGYWSNTNVKNRVYISNF